MQFAYQFPEIAERLVLVSSGGLGPEVSPVLRAAALPGADLFMPRRPAGTRGRDPRWRVAWRPSGCGQTRTSPRSHAATHRSPTPTAGGVPRHAALGHRHRRPARPCRRSALPSRGHARADHLGRARFDNPRSTTARTRTRRFRAAASRCSKGSAICRNSRRPGASSRCSSVHRGDGPAQFDSEQRRGRLRIVDSET